ncbi:hypothetical protein [Planctobacterium marinum]|uniref:hypothetical protein n=1 Tax=Planctobacterium marinum TaxID=1631968 RepID=UPI001E2B6C04|nr:hypothetical protein [Planctobacterium marinum]MCC2608006.1 hypothetical protein [Planctobacterium marinum]
MRKFSDINAITSFVDGLKFMKSDTRSTSNKESNRKIHGKVAFRVLSEVIDYPGDKKLTLQVLSKIVQLKVNVLAKYLALLEKKKLVTINDERIEPTTEGREFYNRFKTKILAND